ncbi:carboxypeptidase [Alkalicaulis satelles]|uniref:Carboxypeptidase n=1 Tax=Alkalicaulis satelles TaxID=2609175 RepID=A0A5M6ZI62_9PROT|nr:M14 family zinc carboxypeptidase [Alkalicaulis satelles]KAA5804459.1 carboxypeptidase [Alkalicaulis satelles]
MLRLIAASLALVFAAAAAHAYEPKPAQELLAQDISYDAAIPKPEDITGFAIGDVIWTPAMHAEYARAIAGLSDRMTIETIGRSTFGRPIQRVVITSPANHARIDAIRETQRGLKRSGASAAPADHPAIIQTTFGVHGSEPSSYDSAALLLYHFAAGQGEAMDRLLEETVIILVIMINPDGADRFANWTNMHRARVPVADPQTREHFHEWPWGRTNHYWFDLNRQWLPVMQPEARLLVRASHEWMPNIAADMHEMGPNTTYFFSPGPLDGLHPLLSQDALQLNLRMNRFLRDQLDGEGQLYVSEELFDDFYLGYGSSYPGLIGSVPYLFEQSSTRGIVMDTDFGVQRYDDKVGQQARALLALIRAGQHYRADLHAHMRQFFNESRRRAQADPVTAWVFTSNDRARLADFFEVLDTHSIEVRELTQTLRQDGRVYRPGEAFIVPVRQDQYRIVQGMFESKIVTDNTEFYDVSGWTQPLAWGLEYSAIRTGLLAPNLTGDRVTAIERAAPEPARARVAYVMAWDSYYAPRALYRLQDAGVRAQVVPDPITVITDEGEVEVGRGAVVVPVARQSVDPDALHALMVRAAREDSVTVHAARSSHTPRGSDLGGFALSALTKPSILLVTGRTVNVNEAGEIWHILDREMAMPVSQIDVSELSRADLSRYNRIILPHGDYSALNESMVSRLNEWVRSGGVLIATRGGARWAVNQELSGAEIFERDSPDERPAPRAYEDINVWDAEEAVSGAIFATEIDLTHPLAFGLREPRLAVQRIGEHAFARTGNPFALPLRYAGPDPLMSGYASQGNREALAGMGVVHAERRGSGAVILFADNPVFRAYFRGSSRVFMNAVTYGEAFRNPRRREDQ